MRGHFESRRAEGEKLKQIEIARNLKSLSLPVETIAGATGLSRDEIQNI